MKKVFFILLSLSVFVSCKPRQIIIQERVVYRDSIVEVLRDTTVYVEIERVVNRDVVHIRDTIVIENRFSTAKAYTVDSLLFLELVQKNQELEFRLNYRERERFVERDSISSRTEIVEVNRRTKMQSFWEVCGYLFAVCIVLLTIYAIWGKNGTGIFKNK